jgi:catechol 2,3-dioxygenase-like lactoylglutathione lyase family enzyme
MGLNLYMVGLIAQNMDKSLEFYRRLGLTIPEGTGGQPHVEVKMQGDVTFFLNAPNRLVEVEGARVILEFYLKDRTAVDAKYNEMIDFGYESAHAPYVTSFGMYFALINDPDGNTILLSAD